MKTTSFRYRGGFARVGAWHGRSDVASLAIHGAAAPGSRAVRRLLHRLRDAGYREVVTGALSPAVSLPLVDEGFIVRERLHLLERPLAELPAFSGRTRRARASDRPSMLALDARAFEEFWRFDERAFDETLRATPSRQVRVAPEADAVAGYAVFGRAGADGYVQRLAVDPDAQGDGLGGALLGDGLLWLRGRGARRVLVNTQLDNRSALRLYEGFGFASLPVGLCVLGRTL